MKAANKGSTRAQQDLGGMYATGEGFSKDLTLARHWYSSAARAGNAEAQFENAFMLLLGEGGPVDFTEGKRLLELAARSGEYQAAKLLTDCFANGKYGFAQNEELSHYWKEKENDLTPKPPIAE